MKRKGDSPADAGRQRVHPDRQSDRARRWLIRRRMTISWSRPVRSLPLTRFAGLGPQGNTQSICHVDHASNAKEAFEKLAASPARSWSARCRAHPVSARPTSSRSSSTPSCAAALRDRVPMTFVTPSPISAISALTASATPRACWKASCARTPHQVDHQCARQSTSSRRDEVEEFAEDGTAAQDARAAFRLFR